MVDTPENAPENDPQQLPENIPQQLPENGPQQLPENDPQESSENNSQALSENVVFQDALEPAPEPSPRILSEHVRSRGERIFQTVSRIVPWVSLVMSVAGAVAMDRSETRGPTVALSATLGWAVLVFVQIVHRTSDAESTGALRKVMRFASTTASQSLVQLSLFFCAPFYFQASSFTLPQILFGLVFVLAAGLTLWDPLCERVLISPIAGPVLMAFASFVGLNAALPMLGMRHRYAVWLAAAVVTVALPFARFLQGARGSQMPGALGAGLLIPLFLALGGVRAIPPAPLYVVKAGIGTGVVERELVNAQAHFKDPPGTLYCYTAIHVPPRLADALDHVWTLNGKVVSRIALDLRGGRQRGFRTWSRLRVSPRSRGTLRCDVVTSLGQDLGGTQTELGSP